MCTIPEMCTTSLLKDIYLVSMLIMAAIAYNLCYLHTDQTIQSVLCPLNGKIVIMEEVLSSEKKC